MGATLGGSLEERGAGDTDYLSGAGRWLQARQENSACSNYSALAVALPSCHLLVT